jgi:tape measure domain-containing protein
MSESRLIVKIDGSQAKREARSVEVSLERMGKEGDKVTVKMDLLAGGANRATKQMSFLKRAVSATAAVMVARKVAEYADSYTNLTNKLKTVTDSEKQLLAVEKALFDTAQNTRASYDATVTTYTRLTKASETLGFTQKEMIRVTETLNKSVALGGATSQEAAAGLVQFSQGIASGKLAGDELKSVMENLLGVSDVLIGGFAKLKDQGEITFEVTRGNIRDLAADGKLNAELLLKALLAMSDETDKAFGDMDQTIGQSMTKLGNALGKATAKLAGSTGFTSAVVTATNALTEFFEVMADDVDPAKAIQREIDSLNERLLETGNAFEKAGLERTIKQLRIELKALNDEAKKEESFNEYMATLKKLRGEGKKIAAEFAEQSDEFIEYLEKRAEQTEKNIKTNDGLIDSMQEEIDMLGMSERERYIAIQVRQLEVGATEKQIQKVKELAGIYYDEQAALKAAEESTEELSKTMDTILTRSIERVDDAFVDLWKSGLDSFDDFKETLIDSFKQMIAELIHQATTKKIVLSLGASFGLGGAGTAAASGGSVSGGISLLSGAKSLFSDPLGTIMSGANFLGGGLQTGAVQLANLFGLESTIGQSILSSTGSIAQLGGSLGLSGGAGFLAGAGITAGAGILGGMAGTSLGESLFGKQAESSIGATSGALIGTLLFGPLGALGGGALGGALDALFGGDGKKRVALGVSTNPNWNTSTKHVQNQTTAASGLNLTAYTKRTGSEGVAAVNDMLNQFATIDAALTELATLTGATIDLSGVGLAGKNSEAGHDNGFFFGSAEYNEISEQQLKEAPDKFIKAWLDATLSSFDEQLQPYIAGINGTAEEMTNQFGQLVEIQQVFEQGKDIMQAYIDNAQGAHTTLEQLTEAYEDQNKTLQEVWRDQGDAIIDLAATIDSTEDYAELTALVQQRYVTEIALIAEVQQALQGIAGIFDNTIERIHLDMLGTNEAKFNYFKGQAETLASSLSTMTDPARIMETLKEIDQLTNSAYGQLNGEQKTQLGQGFINFLEDSQAAGEAQLQKTLDVIESDRRTDVPGSTGSAIQSAINQSTDRMVAEFSKVVEPIQQAAETQLQAANTFGNWAFNLPANIEVNANFEVPEL